MVAEIDGWDDGPARHPAHSAALPVPGPGDQHASPCGAGSPAAGSPLGRAISAAPCPAGSPRTPSPTRRTGELHAIAYFWAWDYVQHVIIGPDGKTTSATDIPIPGGPMMHDFALTEKYLVLFDLPVTFSMDAVSAGLQIPYTWNPDPPGPGRPAAPRRHPPPASAGSRSTRAGCSIPSTPMTTAAGSWANLSPLRRAPTTSPSWPGKGPVTLDRWIIDPAAGKVTSPAP